MLKLTSSLGSWTQTKLLSTQIAGTYSGARVDTSTIVNDEKQVDYVSNLHAEGE